MGGRAFEATCRRWKRAYECRTSVRRVTRQDTSDRCVRQSLPAATGARAFLHDQLSANGKGACDAALLACFRVVLVVAEVESKEPKPPVRDRARSLVLARYRWQIVGHPRWQIGDSGSRRFADRNDPSVEERPQIVLDGLREAHQPLIPLLVVRPWPLRTRQIAIFREHFGKRLPAETLDQLHVHGQGQERIGFPLDVQTSSRRSRFEINGRFSSDGMAIISSMAGSIDVGS